MSATPERTMNVSRWLKGSVWAYAHRSYVRVQLEGRAVRAEVYLTRKQARELRDSLTLILDEVPS